MKRIAYMAILIASSYSYAQTTYYTNPNGMPVGQATTPNYPSQPSAPLTPRAPLSPPTMFNQQ